MEDKTRTLEKRKNAERRKVAEILLNVHRADVSRRTFLLLCLTLRPSV